LPGVELHLDRVSLAAASFLAQAARGEPVSFKERLPRFTIERRIEAQRDASATFVTTTVNVSEGGCALHWPGQLPSVGDIVALRLSGGLFGSTAKSVVCWVQSGSPSERSLGLRVLAIGFRGRAWRAIVKSVAREGARAA